MAAANTLEMRLHKAVMRCDVTSQWLCLSFIAYDTLQIHTSSSFQREFQYLNSGGQSWTIHESLKKLYIKIEFEIIKTYLQLQLLTHQNVLQTPRH